MRKKINLDASSTQRSEDDNENGRGHKHNKSDSENFLTGQPYSNHYYDLL